MSLLELQQAFADAVGSAGAPPAWIRPGDAAGRLAVYRDTVRSVLVKALALNHPAVKKLVGDEFFDWAAALYAQECPARAANLDSYGEGFCGFLETLPSCAALAWLPDVARLDWAVARALHADDADALDGSALAQAIHAGDSLAFVAHPALSLLECRYPAAEIWAAALDGEPGRLERIEIVCRAHGVLVDRDGTQPRVTVLPPAQAQFARLLLGGATLAAALGATPAGNAAAQWLAAHIAAGRIVGWRIADPGEKP